jgi:acetyl esterase/lipase
MGSRELVMRRLGEFVQYKLGRRRRRRRSSGEDHGCGGRRMGPALRCCIMFISLNCCAVVAAEVIAAPPAFDSPAAPPGYASREAAMAAIATGQLKLIEPSDDVPETVLEHRDLEYCQVDGHFLKLDLAVPKQPLGKVPGLIFVHGGAWSGGERSVYRYYITRFAEHGYAAATISYRLSGEATFPAAIHECKCAVRWMKSNADRYGIDADRIAIVGGSAGGHLALMVAYSDDPALEGNGGYPGISSRVAAVVNFYGPVDLTTNAAREAGAVCKFLGGTFEERKSDYELASPWLHLDANDPPTLIFHGSLDQVVSVDQADRLASRLAELDVPYVYDRLEGWPHALDAALIVNEHCRELMLQFFAHYLKAGGAANPAALEVPE